MEIKVDLSAYVCTISNSRLIFTFSMNLRCKLGGEYIPNDPVLRILNARLCDRGTMMSLKDELVMALNNELNINYVKFTKSSARLFIVEVPLCDEDVVLVKIKGDKYVKHICNIVEDVLLTKIKDEIK